MRSTEWRGHQGEAGKQSKPSQPRNQQHISKVLFVIHFHLVLQLVISTMLHARGYCVLMQLDVDFGKVKQHTPDARSAQPVPLLVRLFCCMLKQPIHNCIADSAGCHEEQI